MNLTRDAKTAKMAESLIPGLDGDLPAERGHLPDSLNLKKKANGETVDHSGQSAPESSGSVNLRSQPRAHEVGSLNEVVVWLLKKRRKACWKLGTDYV